MYNWQEFLNNLLNSAGLSDFTADVDAEHHHATVFIHDSPAFMKENLPALVESTNHVIQLVARKQNTQPIFVDINNYRKERERLIVELARATARKAVATKAEVSLPVMNSYERRLAHMELAAHPDVRTESVGKGHGRYVIVKPIGDSAPTAPSVNAASAESRIPTTADHSSASE